MSNTLTIIQGDDLNLSLTFTNSDGSTYNLTGCSIALAVVKNSSTTPIISKTATITNASGGLASINLTPTDTDIDIRVWSYEITLTDAFGNPHPSGYYSWVVTDQGSSTNTLGITVASGTVNVGIQMVGAQSINSVFGRTGVVTAQAGDYTSAQVGALPSTDDLSAIATANPTAANVNLNFHKVTNVATGTATTDVATLGQVLTESINTVAASGATVTLPAPTSATISEVTLTANCTITLPTATAGQSFTLKLNQDATGGRTVTWSGTVKWPNGTTPTLTSTASATDLLSFMCIDGGTWLGMPAGYDFR